MYGLALRRIAPCARPLYLVLSFLLELLGPGGTIYFRRAEAQRSVLLPASEPDAPAGRGRAALEFGG